MTETDYPMVTTAAEAVAVARSLAPLVDERALEGERAGRVSDDVIGPMRESGLLKMFLPKSLGGIELDPLSVVEIVRTISKADGSTGFTMLTLNATSSLAWLEPDVAKGILAEEPGGGYATVFAPLGRAVEQPDGSLVVNGRWPFNTGCRNAAWFVNGVMVMDGDKPATVPPGRPDWRLVFFPSRDAHVHDTWHTAGLRGTGSNDVEVSGIRVPRELCANPIFEPARHDGPIFRWSFFSHMGVMFSGFPLGVAERALEEFKAVAPKKSRGSRPLADEPTVELAVARAEGALRAARAFVMDVLGEAWEHTLAGNEITLEQRASVRLAASHAMRTGVEVAETAFRLSGGSALYDHSPVQRCWRDAHACSHHGYFSEYQEIRVGRAVLGVPVPDEWMM